MVSMPKSRARRKTASRTVTRGLVLVMLPRCACRANGSEGIGGGDVANRNPLPLGEFVPVGGAADAGAVARLAAPPERIDHLVTDGLIVNVEQSCAQPRTEPHRPADRARDDPGRQTIFGVVGECDRLFVAVE